MANFIDVDKLPNSELIQDFKGISVYNLHLSNQRTDHNNVIKWIEENLSGRWTRSEFDERISDNKEHQVNTIQGQFVSMKVMSLPGFHYYFRDKEDYVAFKLTWT